jgi:cytochrome c oxidase subunit 2
MGTASASSPKDWGIGFQNASTDIMEEISWLYNLNMIILGGVCFIVFALLFYTSVMFRAKNNPVPAKFTGNIVIEIVWIAIPILLLIIIAIPSFKLIYKVNNVPKSDFTVKVVGYQWYWYYEYPDHGGFGFDSYMIPDKDLKEGQLRLLEVDRRVVVPIDTTVRFIITGGDVIHSFAIPSAGIKTDAVPGRLNETWVKIKKEGVYYGQCSELCGVNHGFMPIALEAVSKDKFNQWVKAQQEQS